MAFAYAAAGSGPSAGGIGWANFGNLNLQPGGSPQMFTGTLNDGTKVTFDVSVPAPSAMTFNSRTSPSTSVFGYYAYVGTGAAQILLQNDRIGSLDPGIITINNIVVTDSLGNPVTNYTVVVADAEESNIGELWNFQTDGGVWNQFYLIQGSGTPSISGLGSPSVTITGVDQLFSSSYLLTTESAKNLTLTAISAGGLEAVAIGFAITKVSLSKNIGDRIDSNDQFVLDIQGNPSDQATTTGITAGLQGEVANVFGFANTTYTINESMAIGSVNPLSSYDQIVSATNLSAGGIVPPTGQLPINVTPQLGDIIEYTILNTAPETFTKSVDKAYADLGDVLTYTITVDNPNNFAVNNVLITDALPAGTTFIDNISSSVPIVSGNNPASGITLSAIGADGTATLSWQVKVNSTLPVTTPITNIASVVVPNGTYGNTNPVTTTLNHADLVAPGNFVKSVTPTNINLGDTITYTLKVTNTGNVSANNVVITDPIPAGTTYVPGSVTATAAFTGDPTTSIVLTAPIAPTQTVTISFQVKAGMTVPAINPIPNQAAIAYTYTVDPADPNGVSVKGYSNTVNAKVSNATLVTKKAVDKTVAYIGDKITYNIAVTNTGNVPANKVVITDPIPNGTAYIPGSLTVSVPYTGSPATAITLTNPIAPGATVPISFQVQVVAIPNPNPINNTALVNYAYTVNPQDPDGVTGTSTSNVVTTIVFTNNYSQQITDIIESVALEEAALAAIANAEGAKIQKLVATAGITPQELLCVNQSVADMLDSISILEAILKQKLNTVNCQICPTCM